MTARTFVYATLATIPSIQTAGGEPRVFAKKSMTSSVEDCPYIVYKLGYSAAEDLSETIDADRQFMQIWVHDYHDGQTADYMRIDGVIRDVRAAFKLASSPEDGVIAVRYLETSQDLNDETLNTVMRYVRFQLINEEQS
jgi:hypothetical protein